MNIVAAVLSNNMAAFHIETPFSIVKTQPKKTSIWLVMRQLLDRAIPESADRQHLLRQTIEAYRQQHSSDG